MILIAELATAHGGDLGLAEAMIAAAAEAGADYVKVQVYSLYVLNPSDPQAEWLQQSHLGVPALEELKAKAWEYKVRLLATPFDDGALEDLLHLDIPIKIASSESGNSWWRESKPFAVSWPWGKKEPLLTRQRYNLTAIPLYPTPLECVGRAQLLDGWSDHCEGISACLWAIARGAQVVEAHLTIPGARQKPWDKTPAQMKEIKQFGEAVETMTSGVGQVFRERWRA